MELARSFAAFDGRDCHCRTAAGQAGVDGFKNFFGDWDFGEGKEESGVDLRGRSLSFGVELADRFDLVTEEIDAHGTVLLGGVDVQDATTQGQLSWHFYDVDAGVADGEQVLDKHVGQVFFPDFE